ncbi:MAG: EF-hand domain-containing protein [Thermoguttaceae bacterium]|nr:EF-hand domain-containing protein [Thermoguttaceae bacterium]
MKKTLIIAVAIVASSATFAFSQDNGNRGQRRAGAGFLAAARTEDGKIDLSKVPEQMSQQRKDALKAADKDGDGFLDAEEFRATGPARGERQEGGPGRNQGGPQGQPGPGFGAPGMGFGPMGGPGMMTDGKYDLSKMPEQAPQEFKDRMKAADKDGDGFLTCDEMRDAMPPRGDRQPGMGFGPMGGPGMMTDGKLDLSKLPEQTPQEVKDRMKAADKDGDGFLTFEEMRDMPRPKFRFPEGKKPDFVNDDNGLIVEKITEALKSFDKDNDGIVNEAEQKEMADAIQKEFGPSFLMFIQSIIGGPQGMRQPGMGFGAPQGFGFGGQQGMGFGGQQGFGFGFGGPQPMGPRQGGPRPQERR